jgi:hypothetical protein
MNKGFLYYSDPEANYGTDISTVFEMLRESGVPIVSPPRHNEGYWNVCLNPGLVRDLSLCAVLIDLVAAPGELPYHLTENGYITGLAAAEKIRQSCPDIPIYLLSYNPYSLLVRLAGKSRLIGAKVGFLHQFAMTEHSPDGKVVQSNAIHSDSSTERMVEKLIHIHGRHQ